MHGSTTLSPQRRGPTTPVSGLESIDRVLLVDDSRAQLAMLSAVLRPYGMQIDTATSADEALALIADRNPDLILSDWVMPGMTGPELCRRLRAQITDRYRYFILLTSKNAKEDIAEGLDAGADDFLSKPVNGDELRARMTAGARILAMERELNRKNEVIGRTLAELQGLYDAIEQDLKQARNIQRSLVPETFRDFGPATVSLLLEPCGHVGGDLVGMFRAAGDSIGLYNLDVSGHGIASSLISARVAGYFTDAYPMQNIALVPRGSRFDMRAPRDIVKDLNARLTGDSGVSEYLTMAFAAADLRTGVVRVVQAGHPPPLLLRAGGEMQLVGAGGLPVGLIPGASYDEIELQLRPGDRLLFYSDGFSETALPDGSLLEESGVMNLARDSARKTAGPEFLSDLYWRLCALRGAGREADDDVSALLLEMK